MKKLGCDIGRRGAIAVYEDGVEWKIDKPDIWDGASIPRAFWWLIGSPFIGDYRSAAAIHDVFCKNQSRSSKRTHAVFCEMLEDLGLGVMKRTAMCKAVKWFGPKW